MFFNRSSVHKVHLDKICVLLRLGEGILSGRCPKTRNVFYLLVDMRRSISIVVERSDSWKHVPRTSQETEGSQVNI